MPFGHNCEFPDFDACVRKMQDEGHSTQESRNICGALMRDTEERCKNLNLILNSVRQRPYRKGFGIHTADQYLCRFLESVGDPYLKEFAGTDHEKWDSLIKEAAQKLTYHNWTMKFGEFKSSGDMPEDSCAVFDCVVTTTRRDRDGDVLESSGATLDAKMPLLSQHNPLLPIGKFVAEGKRSKKEVHGRFAIVDTEMGRDHHKLAKFGALRISHGFIPEDVEPLEENGKSLDGWHVRSFEIMEVSLVSIPSNVDAEIIQISGKDYEKAFKKELDGIRAVYGRDLLETEAMKSWAKGFYDSRPVQGTGFDAESEEDDAKETKSPSVGVTTTDNSGGASFTETMGDYSYSINGLSESAALKLAAKGADQSEGEQPEDDKGTTYRCPSCGHSGPRSRFEHDADQESFDVLARSFAARAASASDEDALENVINVAQARLSQIKGDREMSALNKVLGVG